MPARKLTPEKAVAARWQYHFGARVRALAIEYGVSHCTMSFVLRGITYKDAGGPVADKRSPNKLTPTGARNMRVERARTLATTTVLGPKYGVSPSEASLVLRGIAYPAAGGPTWKRLI